MTDEQRILEAKAHLGAAIRQRSPRDDLIIAEHIEDAFRLLNDIGIALRPHIHRSIDGRSDLCVCGEDIRHEVHRS